MRVAAEEIPLRRHSGDPRSAISLQTDPHQRCESLSVPLNNHQQSAFIRRWRGGGLRKLRGHIQSTPIKQTLANVAPDKVQMSTE